MTNSDFIQLIRSEEISKAIRPPRKNEKKAKIHRNPLKKHALMVKLNPYASVLRRAAVRASQPKKKEEAVGEVPSAA
jgi:large subunit ribosomal protein L4e